MSTTSIKASWVWEEVFPGTFWLKVMTTLKDESGIGIPYKSISIYQSTAQHPGYFSYIIDKITDDVGSIGYNFISLEEQFPMQIRFDFLGDSMYFPSTSLITVKYLENPINPWPLLILSGVFLGMILFT